MSHPVTTAGPTLDPDALTMAAVRDGVLHGRPVTVLGLARSGIALARFLVDAGALVTIYDGRPEAELETAIRALEGRPVRLVLGPNADPATAWAGAALVTTSPSINPDYPTTEPRLRAALTTLVAARAAGEPGAPALIVGASHSRRNRSGSAISAGAPGSPAARAATRVVRAARRRGSVVG